MLAFNYFVWYVFMFIAVMWLILLFRNPRFYAKRDPMPLMDEDLPEVSVIIPAYNEEDSIKMTIQSLLNIDYPREKLEIIVVDDCSTDRTADIVKGEFSKKGVRLLKNMKNGGKAFSLNRGIKASKFDIVGCVDADSLVDSKALRIMIEDFDNPEVGSVTPALRVYKPKGLLQRIQNAEYLLNIFLRKTQGALDAIHVTPGVFSLYRKDVLNEIGGFDIGNIAEDMEVALNIHHKGYKITNRIDAITYTLCPKKFRELYKQRLRWYRGALHNMYKYKGMMFNGKYGNIGVFLLPMNLVAIMAVIFMFSLMAYSSALDIMRTINYYSLINWDLSVAISKFWEFRPDTLFNNLFSTTLLMGSISVSVGIYLLYKSFQINDETFTLNRIGFFSYLFIYPILMMFFWFAALFHELFRLEKRW